MCLVLERKRPDKYLIGFVDNGIWNTIQRGIILSVGFWLFYLGLGIGTILLASVKIWYNFIALFFYNFISIIMWIIMNNKYIGYHLYFIYW